MKVVLTSDIADLGPKGSIVDVSDGYARNYLLPRKLAAKATPGTVEAAEKAVAARVGAERKARDEAEKLASGLAGTRVVLAAQAGDEGRLYGSVSVHDIVEGIRKFTGIEVDRKHIELAEPIKAIGLHEVQVKLHPDIEFPVIIDVIPA
ncbi:MAG TPA: 50S ribosomal protein L9 [Acidimicrobiia bacterium]|nr:50S ribosomal protein L9 [Acidimicrobiia bacterium]